MKKFLSAVICLSTILAWQPAQSGSFINWQPLIKEVVATSPGIELIAPLFLFRDVDQDGDEDALFVSFTVWDLATNTKLFKTTQKGVNLPALPCTNAVSFDTDFDVKFTNETGGRSNVVVLFIMECTESGTFEFKEAIKTIVYSADVTVPPGTGGGISWLKAWNEDSIAFNNLDWDNDGQKEIILTLATENPNGAEDALTVILQQSNGAVEATARHPITFVTN